MMFVPRSLWHRARGRRQIFIGILVGLAITLHIVGRRLLTDSDKSEAEKAQWSIVQPKGVVKVVKTEELTKHVEYDKYDKDEILERFRNRSILAKTVCEKFRNKIRKQGKGNLIYLEEQNILFCSIEKAASTFWKRILFSFDDRAKNDGPFSVKIDTAYHDTKNHKVNEKENLTELSQTSNSFIFVRHPFTRLFSGWLDKFFANHPGFWNYGLDIIKSERQIKGQGPKCGHDVSFQEFINYISKKLLEGEGVNSHFTPCFYHCDVCHLDFKYIGKYETLREDTKFIIEEFGMGNNLSLFENFEDKSELDMIEDAVDWLFKQKNKIIKCISFQCGVFRVWKRLTCRGVISKKQHFPYTTAEQANKLTKSQFRNDLIAAHKRSDPKDVMNSREEVLAEAFQSLDKLTFERMVDTFLLDFELFGYSSYPYFQQYKVPDNPKELYLQKCPYE